MDTTIIVKLLFDYMDIAAIARLRILSKDYRDVIDRHWTLIKNKMIWSIGKNDINNIVRIVYRNDELLMEVLKQRKLNTGFVLYRQGLDLSILMDSTIARNNGDSISPKSRALIESEITENVKLYSNMGIYTSATNENLKIFKRLYYDNPYGPIHWKTVLSNYLGGRIQRNVRNYKLNWDEIELWDKTDFYKFIKPSIRANYLVHVILMFTEVSQETRRREHNNIINFIRRALQPYIEQEKTLLQDILAKRNIKLPILYGKDTHRTKHLQATNIMQMSLIRNVFSVATMIDVSLAKEYFEIAHELFDLSNDVVIDSLMPGILIGQTFELLEYFQQYYRIPVSIFTLLLVIINKLDISVIKDPILKAKTLIIAGADIESVKKIADITTLEENHVLTLDVGSFPLDVIPWMSHKRCMELYKKLPYGARSHELFITRDVEFWEFYMRETLYIDEKKVSEMALIFPFMSYQMSLHNIDVVRHIFNCCDDGLLNQIQLDKSNPNTAVFHNLWKEVLLNRGIPEEAFNFDQMVMGNMYH